LKNPWLFEMMKTVAIIPAGGSGKRLGAGVAKQYLMLHQCPVLVHVLAALQKSDVIDDIILVVPEDDLASIRERIIEKYGLSKISTVVAGGRERQDSVLCGLRAITEPCDVVLVSDGVRPFITQDMIAQVVTAAVQEGAAAIGVKAKDTIKETTDGDMVAATLPRQHIWQTQTPQAFQYELLCEAYAEAEKDHFYGTDDASLVERIGAKVRMIAGSYENIKITTPEDLVMAEALMGTHRNEQPVPRSGLGYDSHRFVKDRKLILGGVEIPYAFGLSGHSDADVLLHAVCDALLGMAGCGDIGRHFPDTDPAYQNISSLLLLERVQQIIGSKSMIIHNIDVTVIMEKPKLAAYAAAMVENIAKTLNISETTVNIKAKTNEGMGFVGRGEGVAVLAIASGSERTSHD
jgi:2-C-methyl-D-erythritol 4-phosphate cytidylyltransferase/2-C-methyl-D-erythritol 2,4-cyclodiphosphate synthase